MYTLGTFFSISIVSIAVGIIVALCFNYFFHKPLQIKKEQIEQVQKFLSELDGEDQKLSIIDAKLKLDPFLYPMWKKYKRNLIQYTWENGSITYYSSMGAEEIFNLYELTSGLSFDFWKNLAGVYTGLGILGTFLGLTWGIGNIDVSTTAGLQNGISSLLSGTSTAFITSIVGILFALGFNVFFHCYEIKKFLCSVNELCNTIDDIFPYKKAEDILCWQLEESKNQTATLKSLSADLGQVINETLEDVQDALEKSIESNFKPLFEELLTTIQALNSGGMTALTESFNEGAGKQIMSFSQTLGELEQGMKTIMEESRIANQNSIQQLGQSIDILTKKMNETITSSVEAHAEGAMKNQQMITEIIQEVRNTMGTAVTNMVDASAQSQTTLTDTMTHSSEIIEQMTANWKKGVEEQSKGFTIASEKIKGDLQEALTFLRQELENHEQRTLKMLESFNGTVNFSSTLVEKAGTTAERFSQVAEPMQSVAQEMDGQLTKVIDATGRFNAHVEKHSALFHDSITKNAHAMEKIETSVGTLEKSWKAYEEKFGIVNEKLGETFKILLDNIRQYNDLTSNGLKENLKAFDNSITTALNGISGLNEELTSGVEDLNHSIKELKESIQSLRPNNVNETYRR